MHVRRVLCVLAAAFGLFAGGRGIAAENNNGRHGAKAPDTAEQQLDRQTDGPMVPDDVEPPESLGLPSRHTLQLGLVTGYTWEGNQSAGRFFLDDHALVELPQFGGIRFTNEIGVQYGRDWVGFTGGMFGTLFGIQSGFEYDSHREDILYRLAVNLVARRGGLTSLGDRLRLEWVPATKTVHLGVTFYPPWQKRRANRPRYSYVPLTKVSPSVTGTLRLSVDSLPELKTVKRAVFGLEQLLTPRVIFDVDSPRKSEDYRERTQRLKDLLRGTAPAFTREDSVYHAALDGLFARVAGGDARSGSELARIAEHIILQEFVIPVNRLFGQSKRPFDMSSFINRSVAAFRDSVEAGESELTDDGRASAGVAFSSVLRIIDDAADDARSRWDDDKLVWLPLNLGLRPEQYDSPGELNMVLSNVLGVSYSNANRVELLHGEQGYFAFERLVRETKYYHVLHIHDIRGQTGGVADVITWRLIADGYLRAFTDAVREMDEGKRDRLPQFMIFLDQHYYELNRSRPVLKFLENLYTTDRIPVPDSALKYTVRTAKEELQRVVAGSTSLAGLTKDEIGRMIRVHVNVTNVFDPVYSEDAVARDHRKLAFRDVFEDQPGLGEGLFSGMGIGELYVGPCWDDRTLAVRGPALVHLKAEARELLLSQGYKPEEVPYYLKPRDYPSDYESACDSLRALGWTAGALDVFNQTGFGSKQASILKAALYNLMRPGTTIVIPDSLWACDFWGSMLAASALRGCRVTVIAPAKEYSPSDADITIESIRKTLKAIVTVSHDFDNEISRAGGTLRLGLYRRTTDVRDFAEELRTFVSAANDGTGLTRMLGPGSELQDSLTALSRVQLSVADSSVAEAVCTPKLHLKTEYFLGPGADRFLGSSRFAALFAEFCRERLQQSGPAVLTSLSSVPDSVICVYTIGSHNEDRRSMLLDGEALVYLSSSEAFTGVIDIMLLCGAVDWVDEPAQLDREFPRAGGILRAIARFIKNWI